MRESYLFNKYLLYVVMVLDMEDKLEQNFKKNSGTLRNLLGDLKFYVLEEMEKQNK